MTQARVIGASSLGANREVNVAPERGWKIGERTAFSRKKRAGKSQSACCFPPLQSLQICSLLPHSHFVGCCSPPLPRLRPTPRAGWLGRVLECGLVEVLSTVMGVGSDYQAPPGEPAFADVRGCAFQGRAVRECNWTD